MVTLGVPRELEDAVHAATRAAIGDPPLATSALTRSIVDRSLRYTSDRGRLGVAANSTGDLAARAAFFTIADAMKIAIPLHELASRDALPAARPLRITDLGAGCGAMSLGMLATLDPSIGLTILAIDRDKDALGIAATAVRSYAATRGVTAAITTRADDATRTALPAADLVVIGTLLNELAADAQLRVVERALASIGDDGAVIVIEPALRDTARALHELRDTLVGRGAAHVFAPCTRAIAPCPALADPSDWCHEDRAITLSPRTAELARLTHLRDGGLKFAYLVLRRAPLPLVDAPGAWRIVSAPRPAKGKLEVIGCGDAGRVTLRLLKRNRTDANRDLERADRGDVVITNASPGEDRLELAADSTVDRRRPGG